MLVLGVNAFTHDSAAALVADGRVVAFAEEERFARRKHTGRFPEAAIRFCLETAGCRPDEVDVAAFAWSPGRGLVPRALAAMRRAATLPHKLRGHSTRWWQIVRAGRPLARLGVTAPLRFVPHHTAHAAGAFFPSPFDQAAILIVEGVGEIATTSLYRGEGLRLTPLEETRFPHSLGLFYAAVTEHLGFRHNSDEGKVMGLAPYGTPRFLDELRGLVRVTEGGRVWVDPGWFDLQGSWTTPRFARRFGPRRDPRAPLTADHQDLAASAQARLEECCLALARRAHAVTGLSRLCFTGGVALNCVANGRIARETPFTDLFLTPAAYDAGTALGAALAVTHAGPARPRAPFDPSPFLGPAFDRAACAAALRAAGRPGRDLGEDIFAAVAERIAAGKVVGWFRGRMEVGPRALGNRSILGDPRDPGMQDRLNHKVKHREPFRPFAPAVLAEAATTYFAIDRPSPYMLLVCDVRPEMRERLPAVTHVDGTARLQTVTREDHPDFARLLEAVAARTGVPVVLNTSFNLAGETMALTPADALSTFQRSGMDCLALGDFLLDKDEAAS